MTQSQLAESLDVSVPYLNRTMTGAEGRHASPQWADLVADALKLSAAKRAELHAAAALDAGYRLDLTPSAKNRR